MHISHARLSVKEVLLYPRNNNNQHRGPRPASTPFSFKQVEITRTTDGNRRLFRCELNGKVTGFVEKQFKDNVFVREFALGGPRNGVDEVVATARFTGVEVKPVPQTVPAEPEAEPTTTEGLPAFITKSEPLIPGKPGKPKARSVPVAKVAPTPKPSAPRRVDHKPMTRREGLELAGSLFKKG